MCRIKLSEHPLLWCFGEEDAHTAAKKIAHEHNLVIDDVYFRQRVFSTAWYTYTLEGWYAKFSVQPAAGPAPS
jgi:hypothetical protein